jgi:uncharacterized damage-inducible protein DinB
LRVNKGEAKNLSFFALWKHEEGNTMQDLRYPIGRCPSKAVLTPDERRAAIEAIAQTPDRLKSAIAGLSPEQLDTPYRPGGWTVRQVIHHLPESHMNSYVRFKLALTENEPTIKPYDEAAWAKTGDVQETPVEVSLALLEALHKRWVILLRAMKPEDFARRLVHPERGTMTLDDVLTTYSWHGKHHVAHITSLRHRMGWGH